MADETILAPIRRFWSKERVESAYRELWEACQSQALDQTIIIGKSSGEDSANAQLVVTPQMRDRYLEAFEVRLKEYEAEEAEEGTTLEHNRHTDFGCRHVRT
jgi:hypothetical protein